MNNHSILRYTFFISVVLILLILCLIYILFAGSSGNWLGQRPLNVYTTDNGSVVSLFKDTPPLFPKEVILDDVKLSNSSKIVDKDGVTLDVVSYVSDKSMQEVVEKYNIGLSNLGWTITNKKIYETFSIINATKQEQKIVLTIASLKAGEVHVTLHYEK